MIRVEHIGIAVKNLAEAQTLFARLFTKESYKQETVESEGVTTSFFQLGETKIELLEATRADSPIAKFIDRKGEGIHHIAFEVVDIRAEIRRLQADGFEVLNEEPKQGADNKLVAFLHPRSTQGILVEICQTIV